MLTQRATFQKPQTLLLEETSKEPSVDISQVEQETHESTLPQFLPVQKSPNLIEEKGWSRSMAEAWVELPPGDPHVRGPFFSF